MKIEILGDNCGLCRLLKHNIEKAIQSMSTTVELITVGEPEIFVKYGLLSLPGIVIDGVLRSEGRLLSTKELIAILQS